MDTSGSSKQDSLSELSKQLKSDSVTWSVKRNSQIRKSTFGQRSHTSKSCDVLLSIPQLGPHCQKVCQVTMRTHWTCGMFSKPKVLEGTVSHWLKKYETATAEEQMVTQVQDTALSSKRWETIPIPPRYLSYFLRVTRRNKHSHEAQVMSNTGVDDWPKSVPAGHF